jgi:hypothetical protein
MELRRLAAICSISDDLLLRMASELLDGFTVFIFHAKRFAPEVNTNYFGGQQNCPHASG